MNTKLTPAQARIEALLDARIDARIRLRDPVILKLIDERVAAGVQAALIDAFSGFGAGTGPDAGDYDPKCVACGEMEPRHINECPEGPENDPPQAPEGWDVARDGPLNPARTVSAEWLAREEWRVSSPEHVKAEARFDALSTGSKPLTYGLKEKAPVLAPTVLVKNPAPLVVAEIFPADSPFQVTAGDISLLEPASDFGKSAEASDADEDEVHQPIPQTIPGRPGRKQLPLVDAAPSTQATKLREINATRVKAGQKPFGDVEEAIRAQASSGLTERLRLARGVPVGDTLLPVDREEAPAASPPAAPAPAVPAPAAPTPAAPAVAAPPLMPAAAMEQALSLTEPEYGDAL